uniref:Secreted protein n=1 Tax=Anopheles farauti TaxID=69004 RepID=A0A182Q8Y5_9DIPT
MTELEMMVVVVVVVVIELISSVSPPDVDPPFRADELPERPGLGVSFACVPELSHSSLNESLKLSLNIGGGAGLMSFRLNCSPSDELLVLSEYFFCRFFPGKLCCCCCNCCCSTYSVKGIGLELRLSGVWPRGGSGGAVGEQTAGSVGMPLLPVLSRGGMCGTGEENLHLLENQPLQTLHVHALVTSFGRFGETFGKKCILILAETTVYVRIDRTLQAHRERVKITLRIQTVLNDEIRQLLVDVGDRFTRKLYRCQLVLRSGMWNVDGL